MIRKIATVVALCVMGAVAGCRSLNAENYRCSEAGQCPSGFTCGGDGRCHSGKDAGCEGGSCRTDGPDGGDGPKVLNPGCPGDNSPSLDCPCATNGSPACNGAHQPVKLRCTGGVWVDNGTCAAGNNCDQSDGLCHPIIPECQTGTTFCSDMNTQQTCNADRTSTVPTNCAGVCSSNVCQMAVCGDRRVEASLNEECDDGNATADDGCESNCKRSTVIGLAAGASHTCALLGSGNVRCWGDNMVGQLGIGNPDFKGTTTPYVIPSVSFGAQATAIASGADHTCALLNGGTVRCWGKNNHGQHGQGDAITTRLSPAPALTFPSPATKIAAGNDTTCVVLQSGAVHCWGGNASGMLGKATTVDICASAGATCLSAVAVGASASAIAVGSNAVCVVLTSGGITCWGGSSFGELGRSDTMVIGDIETPAAAPAPATPVVPAGRSATLLAAGSGHTCARLDNGQMECWGLNTAGQLALGLSSATFAIGDNESPSTNGVTQLMTVSALFASNTSSCAKLVAGGIRCWGNNNKGQLGYPDTTNKGGDTATIPSNLANVNFGAGLTATTMALGASHGCALLNTGEVRCWGRDNLGQLGNAMTLSGTMDFIGGANMTPDTVAAVQVFPP